MAYLNKHNWANDSAPYLSAQNLNEMEEGIESAHNLTKSLSSIFIGFVAYYCKDAAPNGWIECDGRAISRTEYSDLFNVIGTTFGAGDGSTTFNIPDLRSEFIRGWDDGKGIDSGRIFGSNQEGTRFTTVREGSRYFDNGESEQSVSYFSGGSSYRNSNINSIAVRPRNVALLPCIYTGVSDIF